MRTFLNHIKNETLDEIKTSLENLWQQMIQLSESFQYSFVLLLKRKCLARASRVRSGESGTPSTIIYVTLRWNSRRYELGCDTPVCLATPRPSLWIPYDACHIGEYSHQWSPVSAERECWHRETSGYDSPWQLVSACAIARCWGPCRRDHANTSRSPAARLPATQSTVMRGLSHFIPTHCRAQKPLFVRISNCMKIWKSRLD